MASEQETPPAEDDTPTSSDGLSAAESDDTLIISGATRPTASEDTVLVTDPPAAEPDEAWPVAAQYRVAKEPPAAARDATVIATQDAPATARRRRLPEGPVALALAAVAAVVGALILGAFLLQRDDDGEASDEPGTTLPSGTDTTPGTTPTATTPTAPEAAELPDVVGMTLADARAELTPLGLRTRVTRIQSGEPDGTVVEQKPIAGSEVEEKGLVILTVSRGAPAPTTVEVPDVVGDSSPDAVVVLRDAGLEARVRFADSSEPEGSVIRQAPAAAAEVRRGTTVVVFVARAPQPAAPTTVSLPDVVGATVQNARSRLRELGFRVRISRTRSDDPAGTVVRQAPKAGADLRKGGTVTLTVSTGPAQVAVPDVVGLDEESARLELTDAGFEVRVTEESTDDPAQDGVVVEQNPSGGTDAREGAVVTLVVARFD